MFSTWSDKREANTSGLTEKPISVIVAAHNEQENLKELVPLLLNQNYSQKEIIIALDRCIDKSEKVIRQFQDHPNLHLVNIVETPPAFSGKKFALTRAIEIAHHEILVFTDADCRPSDKNWLKHVNESFTDQIKISIGYSPYLKVPGVLNKFIRYETLLTCLQYFSFSRLGMPYMGVGRNMAYKKSFFQEKGGFGDFKSINGGDDDLFIGSHATRSNINSYYNNESFVFSKAKNSWKSLFKQKRRHLSVGKYYQKKHQLILGLLGSTQIMFWLTFAILAMLKASLSLLVLCFLIRLICFNLFFIRGARTISYKFELLWTPFLDLVHTLFLLIMGPVGFFTKRVKWS